MAEAENTQSDQAGAQGSETEKNGEKRKRGGRGRSKPGAVQRASNVSDDTIIEFCNKALTAKNDVEAAQAEVNSKKGTYRQILKDAKKAGVNTVAVTTWLTDRKREVSDVDKDFRDINRIYKLMNLPVGTQLGLWSEEDGRAVSVATAIERDRHNGAADPTDAIPEEETLQGGLIETHGYNAGYKGTANSENPHRPGTKPWEAWDRGWRIGQGDKVRDDLGGSDAAGTA